jgi:uncharacterized tellurite resistance protein B-like protein
MSFFDLLGLGPPRSQSSDVTTSAAVRDIVERLRGHPPERARWIAAFALVLARGARADLEISGDELRVISDVVHRQTGLAPEQSDLVAELAARGNELLGSSQEYLATREFRNLADDGDAERVLDCLFAVAAADDSITLVEEEELRQIANELGVEHRQFTTIRSRYRDQREVLRDPS